MLLKEMEEIFEDQIDKSNPITEDKINKLKGKTTFGREYEVGQKILYFMDQTTDYSGNIPTVNLVICTFQYPKEINDLVDNYKFIDIKRTFPILQQIY